MRFGIGSRRIVWTSAIVVSACFLVTVASWLVAPMQLKGNRGCSSIPVQSFETNFDQLGLSQFDRKINSHTMSIVPDPSGDAARSVLRMAVGRDDIGPTPASRAQLSSPGNTLGVCTESWIGMSMMIKSLSQSDMDELRDKSGHIMFAQVNGYPWDGIAPIRVGWIYDTEQGHQFGVGSVAVVGSDVVPINLWRVPVVQDRWIDLAFHLKMSTDSTDGFVELYANLGDGRGLTKRLFTNNQYRYNFSTLNSVNYRKGDFRGNYFDLNVYRPTRMKIQTVVAYFAYLRIGNDLNSVSRSNRT